ncbi:hypothetical protein [Paenibacillus jiagnxiensis]|uniref:hypothetical protein n=1 Tax=Paenibacillus jiagnxiensis TaxID=3228926 RepID=UPI0033B7C62A
MNIATKMMIASIGILLFVSAAAVGVQLFRGNHDALNEVDAAISSRDRNMAVIPAVEGEESVSGATVVQTIFQIAAIGADIQVEGYLFSKDVNIDDTDVSMIPLKATYTTEYQRDSQGNLQRVIFRKK